jgi:hypothetical protein
LAVEKKEKSFLKKAQSKGARDKEITGIAY